MKLLPCPRCAVAKGPGGSPVAVGRLSSPRLRFRCRGCGLPVVVGPVDWNRLPECTPEEAQAALATEGTGGGLPPFQAAARVASGLLSPTAGRLVR